MQEKFHLKIIHLRSKYIIWRHLRHRIKSSNGVFKTSNEKKQITTRIFVDFVPSIKRKNIQILNSNFYTQMSSFEKKYLTINIKNFVHT